MRGEKSLRGEEPVRCHATLNRGWQAVAVGLALTAASCGGELPGATPAAARVEDGAGPDFLDAHWRRPLAAQAPGTGRLASALDELQPSACGSCHKAQYDDWRSSLHSRAMGPGVVGQLKTMGAGEREECQRCHAPLAEQRDPASPLHAQGLVCAGCHLREGRVFGPPRTDGTALAGAADMPHGGWTTASAFSDARFCASCHQFEAAGFALNGKLLENTYEEWKASRHAREGRACQSCHMPDRRHLWRGIHDRETTLAGITVVPRAPRVRDDLRLAAGWRVVNSGTGHYFPTYVTPRIVAVLRQETAEGKAIAGTTVEYVIAREVSPDLSEEVFDTRIGPDEIRELDYALKRHGAATHLALELRVEPDAFYTGFYRSLLESGAAGSGDPLIRKALAKSIASQYVLYGDRQAIR